MAYVGNQPISVAFLTDTFSGTGSQTAFTMTVAPANTSSILVAVTGVVQDPSTYSVSGTTLTFSAAPPSGTSNISVRYLGIPASGVTTTAYRTVTNFTATAGQTSFSTPSYTVGYIDVYRNGVRLVSTDFTATTGTTVVLTNACTAGDTVVTESFYVSSVLNAIPNTGGSVSASNLAASGTGSSSNFLRGDMAWSTLARSNMPAGSVLQVVNATYSTQIFTSSATYQDVGLTASITPTSSSSKIMCFVDMVGAGKDSANGWVSFKLLRGASSIITFELQAGWTNSTASNGIGSCSTNYLDSPATTSATTYKVQYCNVTAVGNAYAQIGSASSTITLMEIAA